MRILSRSGSGICLSRPSGSRRRASPPPYGSTCACLTCMQPACNLQYAHLPPRPPSPPYPLNTPLQVFLFNLVRSAGLVPDAPQAWSHSPSRQRQSWPPTARGALSLSPGDPPGCVGHLAVPQAPLYERATQKPKLHPAAPDHPGARRQGPTHAATQHGQNATTAPEDHWLARACPLGLRGEPSPLECRGEAAAALL